MKKLTSILLILLLLCSFSSCNAENSDSSSKDTLPEESEISYSDWKSAYLNLIEQRNSEYTFDYRYALVYVDDDEIPELYAMGICEADGDLVCSYKNGRMIEQRLYRTLGGKYIERSGMLINQNGHMGHFYDIVYRLDENGFSQILTASHIEHYKPIAEDDVEVIDEYLVDGQTVSKDEHHAAINHAIDLSQTVEFFDHAVSYEEIKQQIADSK